MKKPISLNKVIREELKDPEFAVAFERELLINEIAKLIVQIRKFSHFTQAELAERAHTSQPVIARLESGTDKRIPSLELLARLVKAAGAKLHLAIEYPKKKSRA